MLKFLKKLIGADVDKSDPVPALDPVAAVDSALGIADRSEIGDATAALEDLGDAAAAEVGRRLVAGELSSAAARYAAAIWLAHHSSGDEWHPHLDEAIVDTLAFAMDSYNDIYGVVLDATIHAASQLSSERAAAVAARALEAAGRSDQKFRLLKIGRSDALMAAVNEALADLGDHRIAIAETAFRTSFTTDDVELLLRHLPDGKPYASAYIVALGALGDVRGVPALVSGLDARHVRVRDAARRGLQKMQGVAEDAVLALLAARRKGQRLAAAAVLEKWDINDRVRGAVQNALQTEKVAEVREALLPLAPLEGQVNFRSMHDLYEHMAEERRAAVAAAVRRRLDGEQVDWARFAGEPEELLAVTAHELEGCPTGADRCMTVLKEVLDASPDAELGPWASAWFARFIRSLYSKGRPLPWEAWKQTHKRFGDTGLQPLVELLLEYQFEGESTLRWFAVSGFAPSDQHARLLTHTNRDARLDAASAMQNAKPGMTEVIAPMLQDARKETREAAAVALQAIGDPSAEEPLRARLRFERAKDAKQAIEAALTALKLAELAAEEGAIEDLAPTAENHARLDERLAAIGAKPKFDVDTLPPVRWTSGAELTEGAYRWFVSMLEQNDFGLPDAELHAVAGHLDGVDRKHLLDALHAGFDPEHREVRIGWVLFSTVLLGNEDQIAALGSGLDDMARFASSEQAFRRLEVLEHHGSNAAIGWIDHWARKARSAGLRERARAALRRLAAARGVTPEDLADLVFGDYGLDERGVRIWTVGDRTVKTRFDNTGEVGVVKDDGTLSPRFPSQRASDDPTEYERACDAYRAWRKALKRALKGQADRLEWSMVWGRTWNVETFLANYGAHPVLRELAASVLWLAHHDAGQTVVRLDTDLSFSTVEDEPLPAQVEALSVAHPIDIPAGDRQRWHEILVDYMLVSPFPQLDRPSADLPEIVGDELRFENVGSEGLRDRLLNSGWQRGYVEDGGMVYDLDREHPNGIIALVELDPGMYVARDAYDSAQNVCLKFMRQSAPMPLNDVPRCLLAEVCWEIAG